MFHDCGNKIVSPMEEVGVQSLLITEYMEHSLLYKVQAYRTNMGKYQRSGK